MLTGFEEFGRIKCSLYWSDDPHQGLKFESLTFKVTRIHRTSYSDYVLRRFLLCHKPSGTTHEVIHFHYTRWNDFLSSDQPSWLLRFIRRVNEHYVRGKGPILVHCGGVGRSGTFIAIDSLVSKVKRLRQTNATKREVNIFECVTGLRHQRALLVQSLKQYIFVYKAVLEFVFFGDTELEGPQIADHYEMLKGLSCDQTNVEFERLIVAPEDPKTCNAGNLKINLAKNRYNFIIPCKWLPLF